MTIIPISLKHTPFLKEMLYLAFFVPEGTAPFPLSILERPDIKKYYENWGKEGDYGFVAIAKEQLLGAAWCRLHRPPDKGYGFVNEETPELNIAILPAYRGQKIGFKLMHALLDQLKAEGYPGLSLSVDQRNTIAIRLYQKLNFEIINEAGTAFTMIKNFKI